MFTFIRTQINRLVKWVKSFFTTTESTTAETVVEPVADAVPQITVVPTPPACQPMTESEIWIAEHRAKYERIDAENAAHRKLMADRMAERERNRWNGKYPSIFHIVGEADWTFAPTDVDNLEEILALFVGDDGRYVTHGREIDAVKEANPAVMRALIAQYCNEIEILTSDINLWVQHYSRYIDELEYVGPMDMVVAAWRQCVKSLVSQEFEMYLMKNSPTKEIFLLDEQIKFADSLYDYSENSILRQQGLIDDTVPVNEPPEITFEEYMAVIDPTDIIEFYDTKERFEAECFQRQLMSLGLTEDDILKPGETEDFSVPSGTIIH